MWQTCYSGSVGFSDGPFVCCLCWNIWKITINGSMRNWKVLSGEGNTKTNFIESLSNARCSAYNLQMAILSFVPSLFFVRLFIIFFNWVENWATIKLPGSNFQHSLQTPPFCFVVCMAVGESFHLFAWLRDSKCFFLH
jgi:hypothetical protein